MSHPLRLLFFFLSLCAVCVGVTLLSIRVMSPETHWRHDEPHGHHWLHHELALDESQAEALDALLPAYQEKRAELTAEFERRRAALAEILRTSDHYTPEATAAIHSLHAVHSQLQELAIEHYFEMYAVLPPAKQAHLRDLAVEALSTPE